MADLESVLADVSYLMAMERSKTGGVKTVKKLVLPDKRFVNLLVLLQVEIPNYHLTAG
jgi:hypothetical protein